MTAADTSPLTTPITALLIIYIHDLCDRVDRLRIDRLHQGPQALEKWAFVPCGVALAHESKPGRASCAGPGSI